jgi:hypothetical protein
VASLAAATPALPADGVAAFSSKMARTCIVGRAEPYVSAFAPPSRLGFVIRVPSLQPDLGAVCGGEPDGGGDDIAVSADARLLKLWLSACIAEKSRRQPPPTSKV